MVAGQATVHRTGVADRYRLDEGFARKEADMIIFFAHQTEAKKKKTFYLCRMTSHTADITYNTGLRAV